MNLNLDYVRAQIAEKDIDIAFARPALVRQAAIEIQPFAYFEREKTDLTDAWLILVGEPRPAQVLAAVYRLIDALNVALAAARNVSLPVSPRSAALTPDGEHLLAEAAKQHRRAAAILDALDLLGWVMAYDALS